MATTYEWRIEITATRDTEDAAGEYEAGDIMDSDTCTSLAECVAARESHDDDDSAVRIVLVREESGRRMMKRTWAYLLDDGTLPECFADSNGCDDTTVPQKFRDEVARHNATCNK